MDHGSAIFGKSGIAAAQNFRPTLRSRAHPRPALTIFRLGAQHHACRTDLAAQFVIHEGTGARMTKRPNPRPQPVRAMTRKLFALSLGFAGLILATGSPRPNPPRNAARAPPWLSGWPARFGETRRGIGLATGNAVIEVFASADDRQLDDHRHPAGRPDLPGRRGREL